MLLCNLPNSKTMSDIISEEEIEDLCKKVPEWEVEGACLVRAFDFEDFNDAMDFVNSVADIAEEAQHHPDIEIKYDTVTLSLTTHEVKGLTEDDFELAGRIDNLL